MDWDALEHQEHDGLPLVGQQEKIFAKLERAIFSPTFTRRQWESLLSSLNYAAEVVPLGRLLHRRLTLEDNRHFLVCPRDALRPMLSHISSLLRFWLHRDMLRASQP